MLIRIIRVIVSIISASVITRLLKLNLINKYIYIYTIVYKVFFLYIDDIYTVNICVIKFQYYTNTISVYYIAIWLQLNFMNFINKFQYNTPTFCHNEKHFFIHVLCTRYSEEHFILFICLKLYLLTYFFWFIDCKCVSNRPSVGWKLLSGRDGKGEVISLEVSFKGRS